MKELTKRILEISYHLKLSHIGSCTSVLPILVEIYAIKKLEDKVMLSGAHAHLAHLVVKERYEGLKNIEELIRKDIHCNRESGCDVSGGALAHSGIAIGLALTDRQRDVYLIMTDGSLGEGEEWEVMRLRRELQLVNLHIYMNINGYTATTVVDKAYLEHRIKAFCVDAHIRYTENARGFEGVEGHYKIP